jgi:hypothetical protein
MIQEVTYTAIAIVPHLQRLLGNGSAVPLAGTILAFYIWNIYRD